jgi:hypothetical protein
VQPPSNDHLAEIFIDCLKESELLNGASAELIASIERLKTSLSTETKLPVRTAKWSVKGELGRGDSSVVRLVCGSEATLLAVKFAENAQSVQPIQWDFAIHKKLKHPLLFEFRGSNPGQLDPNTITTNIAGNGSLACHLPCAEGHDLCQLRRETRTARILVGIVLAT